MLLHFLWKDLVYYLLIAGCNSLPLILHRLTLFLRPGCPLDPDWPSKVPEDDVRPVQDVLELVPGVPPGLPRPRLAVPAGGRPSPNLGLAMMERSPDRASRRAESLNVDPCGALSHPESTSDLDGEDDIGSRGCLAEKLAMRTLLLFMKRGETLLFYIQECYLRFSGFASKANSGVNLLRISIRSRLSGVNPAGAGHRAENPDYKLTGHFTAWAGPSVHCVHTHRLRSSQKSGRAAIVPCIWGLKVSVLCLSPDKLEPGVRGYELSYYSPPGWLGGVHTPPGPPEIVFIAKLGIR